MKVVRATNAEDVVRVEPIAWLWEKECNRDSFGIDLDPSGYLKGLRELIVGSDSDLLLLLADDDEKIAGFMGLTIFKSPLGNQKIANEHFWFVSGENRGKSSMLLIRAAKEWAKEKGCSHLILNASKLASDIHDRLCVFYERMGFKLFETAYIKEIV